MATTSLWRVHGKVDKVVSYARNYSIMNAAGVSYVILDPKGELLRDTGSLLRAKGYDIKVIDLVNMGKSHCYNPFVYLESDSQYD